LPRHSLLKRNLLLEKEWTAAIPLVSMIATRLQKKCALAKLYFNETSTGISVNDTNGVDAKIVKKFGNIFSVDIDNGNKIFVYAKIRNF